MPAFFYGMARNLDAVDIFQNWPFNFAAFVGQRTTWIETATWWRIQRVGHLALNRRARTASVFHFGNGV